MITKIYLIILIQRFIIIRIKSYTISQRLLENKLVTKFMIIFFHEIFVIDKNFNFLYDL